MSNFKKVSLVLVVTIMLLGAICYAGTNSMLWTGMCSTSNSLDVKSVGAFRTTLSCYGATTVYNNYGAYVGVTFEYEDSDGDFVTLCGWEDSGADFAAVEEDIKVPAGTYRLTTYHRSYALSNPNVYVDSHTMISNEVTTH